MKTRDVYRRSLEGGGPTGAKPLPPAIEWRHPEVGDTGALGALMLDAYHGTTDDEGEGMPEAVEEVRRWFAGGECKPMAQCSAVAWSSGAPVAACLIGWWTEVSCPLVQYVFTGATQKRQGMAKAVLAESLRLLADSGHREVRAVITRGNAASQALFEKAGFAVRS